MKFLIPRTHMEEVSAAILEMEIMKKLIFPKNIEQLS